LRRDRRSPADLDWLGGEVPLSRLYGDVYFSRHGALEESRTVFLGGCGLPAAWANRTSFCVAELGLGTARNIAALIDLWRHTRAPGAHLSIFSIEAELMAAQDAARALAAWPDIAGAAHLLTSHWPPATAGFHRIDLPEFAASLDVAVMEAGPALTAWSGLADAWFLDGFSPARNPQIWREEVLELVRARSAPGARAATYTVAGSVRARLAAQGFSVERAPGFGAKRQRLEASLPGVRRPRPSPGPVAVIGAGIAGAALCRAFEALGVEARVFDPAGAGGGASGGRAALVAPRLDAGLGATAALFAKAARRAADLYAATPGAVMSRGGLQLAVGPKDARRFAAIAGSDLFAAGAMQLRTTAEVAEQIGEAASVPGLALRDALVVSPARILGAWLPKVERARIAALEPARKGWRLRDKAGRPVFEAETVCIAAGMASAGLAPGLGLLPVRGQVSVAPGLAWPIATLFGAYALPTPDGIMFGATHERGSEDARTRAVDDAANLQAVARVLPDLAGRLAARPLSAWAAIRATTGDFLPLAGAVPGAAGLFVLSGLGSRGFCLAPLLAEYIAALALAAPSPLPFTLADLVAPARFAERARRRGRFAFAEKEDAS
jgi:tRNA 5-methylaminomethyl-2-thiouridine biosynthesis bifunctional protein